MAIERWYLETEETFKHHEKSKNGWVMYDDHLAALREQREGIAEEVQRLAPETYVELNHVERELYCRALHDAVRVIRACRAGEEGKEVEEDEN